MAAGYPQVVSLQNQMKLNRRITTPGVAFFLLCIFIGFDGCMPTSEGLSGAAIGGGGVHTSSAENYGPSDFAATANSTTQINLTWTDNSSSQATFVLERSTDETNYSTISEPAAGVTSY